MAAPSNRGQHDADAAASATPPPSSPTTTSSNAILFVSNLAPRVDVILLERLFGAYGPTIAVSIHRDEEFAQHTRYALVSYASVDDADTAIASLHLRYCTMPRVPLVVVYHVASPAVSAYGRRVGQRLVEALQAGQSFHTIAPLPLADFDQAYPRSDVDVPALMQVPAGGSAVGGSAHHGFRM